jgi:hypothetical protein
MTMVTILGVTAVPILLEHFPYGHCLDWLQLKRELETFNPRQSNCSKWSRRPELLEDLPNLRDSGAPRIEIQGLFPKHGYIRNRL